MAKYVRARTTYELSDFSDFNNPKTASHEIVYTTVDEFVIEQELIAAITPLFTTYSLTQYTSITELFVHNTHATDILTATYYSFAGMPSAQKQFLQPGQGIRLTDVNTAFPLILLSATLPITVRLTIIGI